MVQPSLDVLSPEASLNIPLTVTVQAGHKLHNDCRLNAPVNDNVRDPELGTLQGEGQPEFAMFMIDVEFCLLTLRSGTLSLISCGVGDPEKLIEKGTSKKRTSEYGQKRGQFREEVRQRRRV